MQGKKIKNPKKPCSELVPIAKTEQSSTFLGTGLTVFEWCAWDSFLIEYLFPHSKRISINPFSDDDWEKCVAALSGTDSVLFQINLAQTAGAPIFRQRLRTLMGDQGICVLNAEITDLRKRNLQLFLHSHGLRSTIVGQEGPAEEKLIVKTDLNHGGLHERKVDPDFLRSLGLNLPLLQIDAKTYPVLKRKEIAAEWYEDKGLVFERFVTNSHDRFHRAYIAGDHIIVTQAHAEGHIKKLQHDPRDVNFFFFRDEIMGKEMPTDCDGFEPLDSLRQLGRFLRAQHIDYAAIDIVNDGDKSYIIDVNTTPWAGECMPNNEAIEFLRLGIYRRVTEFNDCRTVE